MRLLVTGASGRVGTCVVGGLRARGHTVRAFDRRAPADAGAGESVQGDLGDFDQVRRAVDGVDAVIHLGGNAGEQALAGDRQQQLHRLLPRLRGRPGAGGPARRLRQPRRPAPALPGRGAAPRGHAAAPRRPLRQQQALRRDAGLHVRLALRHGVRLRAHRQLQPRPRPARAPAPAQPRRLRPPLRAGRRPSGGGPRDRLRSIGQRLAPLRRGPRPAGDRLRSAGRLKGPGREAHLPRR